MCGLSAPTSYLFHTHNRPIQHRTQAICKHIPRVAYAIGHKKRRGVFPEQATTEDIRNPYERVSNAVPRLHERYKQVRIRHEGKPAQEIIEVSQDNQFNKRKTRRRGALRKRITRRNDAQYSRFGKVLIDGEQHKRAHEQARIDGAVSL